MNPADFGFSDTHKLEHALTLNFGEKWERPLRKASESLARMGHHWAESFRIIATGLSAYFVLAGLAKLVAATKSTKSTDDSSRSSKGRSSRSKAGSSRDSGGDKTSSTPENSSSSVNAEDASKGNDNII
jgi:hypothetical protein